MTQQKSPAWTVHAGDSFLVYYAFFSKEGFTAEAKKEVADFPTFWVGLPAFDQGLHAG